MKKVLHYIAEVSIKEVWEEQNSTANYQRGQRQDGVKAERHVDTIVTVIQRKPTEQEALSAAIDHLEAMQ